MNIRPVAACRTVKLHGGSVVDEAIRGHRHEKPWSQYAVSGACGDQHVDAVSLHLAAHPLDASSELVSTEGRPPTLVGWISCV